MEPTWEGTPDLSSRLYVEKIQKSRFIDGDLPVACWHTSAAIDPLDKFQAGL